MKNLLEVAQLLSQLHNVDILKFDEEFLRNSIKQRMSVVNCTKINDYYNFLKISTIEAGKLIDNLNNTFSEFFRDPLTFAILEKMILPQIINKKKLNNEKEIRIWSCACSSGQEAYSMAILIDELLKKEKSKITCRIFASDINHESLLCGQNGQYHVSTLNNISLIRIEKYFKRSGEIFDLKNEIKKQVDFSYLDLFSLTNLCPPAAIFGNFDIVFCSNILFYYKPEFQIAILSKAMNSLSSSGYLITSETEREIVKKQNFKEAYPFSCIFNNHQT